MALPPVLLLLDPQRARCGHDPFHLSVELRGALRIPHFHVQVPDHDEDCHDELILGAEDRAGHAQDLAVAVEGTLIIPQGQADLSHGPQDSSNTLGFTLAQQLCWSISVNWLLSFLMGKGGVVFALFLPARTRSLRQCRLNGKSRTALHQGILESTFVKKKTSKLQEVIRQGGRMQTCIVVRGPSHQLASDLDAQGESINGSLGFQSFHLHQTECVRSLGEVGIVPVVGPDNRVIHKPTHVLDGLVRPTKPLQDDTYRIQVGRYKDVILTESPPPEVQRMTGHCEGVLRPSRQQMDTAEEGETISDAQLEGTAAFVRA
mmetsp:Transcript_43869/g.133598  ORF Transcript_43869/g.133598 Transcript_43869/m.133598 type:complete len:318 (-) Transcript_43869:880-1833(-)